jgi:CheY-like chemotaxis protein
LRTLIAEPETDIHKDCLLHAGWPDRVVHENSLAKVISRLRHTLGNDGAALKTVHGYGYRLAAEPSPADWPLRGALFERMRRPLPLLAAALMALVAAGLAMQAMSQSRDDEPPLAKGEAADSIGRVLWVDDHPENNSVEREYLENRKVAVYQVVTTEEALQLLAMYEYDAVISDMNRNDKPLDGIALVREMRSRGDRTPFVLYSVAVSGAAAAYRRGRRAGRHGRARGTLPGRDLAVARSRLGRCLCARRHCGTSKSRSINRNCRIRCCSAQSTNNTRDVPKGGKNPQTQENIHA